MEYPKLLTYVAQAFAASVKKCLMSYYFNQTFQYPLIWLGPKEASSSLGDICSRNG